MTVPRCRGADVVAPTRSPVTAVNESKPVDGEHGQLPVLISRQAPERIGAAAAGMCAQHAEYVSVGVRMLEATVASQRKVRLQWTGLCELAGEALPSNEERSTA